MSNIHILSERRKVDLGDAIDHDSNCYTCQQKTLSQLTQYPFTSDVMWTSLLSHDFLAEEKQTNKTEPTSWL